MPFLLSYNIRMYQKHIIQVFFIFAACMLLSVPHAESAFPAIGPGDVIRVTIHYQEELNTVSRVGETGEVTMPLIGKVTVGGLTTEEAAERIAARLADGYLVNPQVSVFVEEYRKVKGIVIGEVARPGLYELEKGTALFALISKAGGLTSDAGEKAIIRRKTGGKESIITVDLNRLIEQGDMTQDVEIKDEDSIFISSAGVFYVIGEVRNPNAYKYSQGTTVIKAITLAGGFTDRANPEKVMLVRKVDGIEQKMEKVPMDESVRPDDLIIIPESLF
jgi:polysaccharide export outer membrane protein